MGVHVMQLLGYKNYSRNVKCKGKSLIFEKDFPNLNLCFFTT